MGNEIEYIPWAAALKGFGYIKGMLQHTPSYEQFRNYINKLVKPVYSKLGYKTDPSYEPLDIYFHEIILQWACNVGETNCDIKVKDEFAAWMDELNPDSEESNP